MKSKKKIELIFNSVILIILIWLAYKAFYELFINEQGIHYSRVVLKPMGNGTTIVEFALNTPTIASFIVLFSSTLGVYFAITVYIINLFGLNKRTKIYWILQLTSLLICFLSSAFMIYDFFGTAFSGVG